MPNVYGYGRVSHDLQAEKGDSIEGQISRITQYYQLHLGSDHSLKWQGVKYDNQGISAYKTNFDRRPAGRELIDLLEPGDHIIFDKVDRIWRSVADFVSLMTYFKRRQITCHFVDLRGCSVQIGTPMGDFMLNLMVAIAELESATTSARLRERNAHQRARGKFPGGQVPMGCKIVGKKKDKHLEWDENDRAVMAEIVRLRDEEKLSWEQVSRRIEQHLAQVNGRPFSKSAFYKRRWNKRSCSRAYEREKQYRAMNITDPHKIPPESENDG